MKVEGKGVTLAVIAALLLALGAFVAGRFTAPLKVETREIEHVVFKDRVVEKVVTVERAAKLVTQVVYRDREIAKDGTIREHEVETTATKEDTSKVENRAHTATHEGEATVTKTVTTTLRPDWRVAVLAGGSIQPPLVPIAGPLVLGVELDRRIIGGLSAGAWVSSAGAAGASVSFEF